MKISVCYLVFVFLCGRLLCVHYASQVLLEQEKAKQAHTAAQLQIDTAANKKDATAKQTDIIANKRDAAIKRSIHQPKTVIHLPINSIQLIQEKGIGDPSSCRS